MNQVRTKDGDELPLAVRIEGLLRCGTALGAPSVARVHLRLTRETIHFCALVGRSRTKHPAGSPAQAYPTIVTQRDRLDKSSFGLSLDARQPWVLVLTLESDVPATRVPDSAAAGCLNPVLPARHRLFF